MDSDAFERLKHGSEVEIRTMYAMYHTAFVRFIRNAFQCPPGHAEDIYPEAFSILYFKIRNGKLVPPLTSSMQTYLNSVGWNLYHRRYLDKYNREKLPIDTLGDPAETKLMVDEAIIQKERAQWVKTMLEKIGDPCKSILTAVYIHETGYKELAAKFDIPETTLRKRKFDCLAKLRKLIEPQKTEP